MSNVFEYLNKPNNYYKPTSENEQNHYYTMNEIRTIVDSINAKQEQAFHKHYCETIKQIDSVTQSIYNIYSKHIEPTLKNGSCRSFTTDFEYIMNMDIFEQEKYGLVDLLKEYQELKIILDRLKNKSSFIIPYPSTEELLVFNTTKFIRNQHIREQKQNQLLQQLVNNQQLILQQLQSLTETTNELKTIHSSIDSSITDIQHNITDSIEQSNYNLQNFVETSTIHLQNVIEEQSNN